MKLLVPITDVEDDTVSWLQQLNDINARPTVYQNNVLYLHNNIINTEWQKRATDISSLLFHAGQAAIKLPSASPLSYNW